MQYRLLPIRTIETPGEGYLSFFEGGAELPFDIRRIYYIHGTAAGVTRGGHAHRRLRQLLFCPYGCITILLDDGREKAEIRLDSPDKGLLLESGLWRERSGWGTPLPGSTGNVRAAWPRAPIRSSRKRTASRYGTAGR